MIRIYSLLFIGLFFFTPKQGNAWGQTGHRAIGQIAEKYLTPIAKANLDKLLDNESLAEVSNWMDEIKSDSLYDYMMDWHWVSIPDSCNYDTCEKNPNGDVIETIERILSDLENNQNISFQQEQMYIKMLVHLIGDVHQPLHVGSGEDRGGNDVKVTWFWDEETNLHRVWDSHMIQKKELSFTELADFADDSTPRDRNEWESTGVRVWAQESKDLRAAAYELPEDKMLSYRYMFDHWDTVQLRLTQAGVRLAGILNKLYG